MWEESFMRFAITHPVLAAIAIMIVSFAFVPLLWLLWDFEHSLYGGRSALDQTIDATRSKGGEKPKSKGGSDPRSAV